MKKEKPMKGLEPDGTKRLKKSTEPSSDYSVPYDEPVRHYESMEFDDLYLPDTTQPQHKSKTPSKDMLFDEREVRSYWGVEEVHPNRLIDEVVNYPNLLPTGTLVRTWVATIAAVCQLNRLGIFATKEQIDTFHWLDRMYYMYCMGFVRIPKSHAWRVRPDAMENLGRLGFMQVVPGNRELIELTPKGITLCQQFNAKFHDKLDANCNGLSSRFLQMARLDRAAREESNTMGLSEYPEIPAYPGEMRGQAIADFKAEGMKRHSEMFRAGEIKWNGVKRMKKAYARKPKK